jgi:hypothetical protein
MFFSIFALDFLSLFPTVSALSAKIDRNEREISFKQSLIKINSIINKKLCFSYFMFNTAHKKSHKKCSIQKNQELIKKKK